MFIQWHHGGLWFRPETDSEAEALDKISQGIQELGLFKEYVSGVSRVTPRDIPAIRAIRAQASRRITDHQ